MHSTFSYRFSGEAYSGNDIAVKISFRFAKGQIDRYEEICAMDRNNEHGGKDGPKPSETQRNEAEASKTDGKPLHILFQLPDDKLSGNSDCTSYFAKKCLIA